MKNSTKLLLIVMLVGVSTSMKAQNHQGWRGQDKNYGYSYNTGAQYNHHGFKNGFKGYRGFDWVNTRRVHSGYHSFTIVTLKHHDLYVELTLNHHGRIIGKKKYRVRRRRSHESYYYGGYTYNHQDHYINSRDRRITRNYQWEAGNSDYGEIDYRQNSTDR